jgi:hypothetical protein
MRSDGPRDVNLLLNASPLTEVKAARGADRFFWRVTYLPRNLPDSGHEDAIRSPHIRSRALPL